MEAQSQTRSYSRNGVVAFRTTSGEFGGLSNMAAGYPLLVNGTRIETAEALYQACRFPNSPNVQAIVIDQPSPMTAKMKSKHFRNQTRSDWNKRRVTVMRWCLRVKFVQNRARFLALLQTTMDRPIVEESKRDDFWGAKPTENGMLIGCNVLGRLLMELRNEVAHGTGGFNHLEPPAIPNFLLLGQPIGLVEPRLSSECKDQSQQSFLEH